MPLDLYLSIGGSRSTSFRIYVRACDLDDYLERVVILNSSPSFAIESRGLVPRNQDSRFYS